MGVLGRAGVYGLKLLQKNIYSHVGPTCTIVTEANNVENTTRLNDTPP